jgi:hypothetical protein
MGTRAVLGGGGRWVAREAHAKHIASWGLGVLIFDITLLEACP